MLRATLLTLAGTMFLLTGCNTLTGVGHDIQLIGAGLQGGADTGAEFADTMFGQDAQFAETWPTETEPLLPSQRQRTAQRQASTQRTQPVSIEQPSQSDYLRYFEAHQQFQE